MNILLTFDNNYTQHAGVVITSFLANNEGNHVIYIISDYISQDNQKLLSAITSSRECHIHFLFIDNNTTKSFPIGKGMANNYVTIATYFRLFITEVLPKSIDKILYLDSDIIINQPIDDLWNCHFENRKCIMALEEMQVLSQEGCKRLKYPTIFSYFNAGVLLLDLHELKNVYSLGKAIDFMNSNDIKFHDQDVLNGLLYDKKQFMELRFNVMDSFLIKNADLPKRYKNQTASLYRPAIIHFSGPIKPWHKESKNPYTYKYYEYLKLTPWKDYLPICKYQTLSAKTLYYMKRIIKCLLDTLHIKRYRFITIS